jgi:Holliday junction resolvase RusA-like endonuclease
MTSLHFEIPQALYLSQNDRLHWRKKAEKTQQLRLLGRAVGSTHDRVPTPCHMTVELGWPDHKKRDRSNSAPTVKALLDGLVDAKVLCHDDDDHILSELTSSHVEGDKGRIHLTITLTPEEAS